MNQNTSSDFDESFSNNNSSQNLQKSICDGSFTWLIYGPLMVLCALIIACNSMVIVLMCWKESLRTLSNIILVSLAVSDLLTGLVGIPLLFSCSFLRKFTTSITRMLTLCVSSSLFMRFTAVSTVLHFALVACDRYAMVTYSLRYRSLVTRWRVRCALIAVWVISIAVPTVQLTWSIGNVNEFKREDEVYMFILMVAFFALPLLCMFCSYSHILIVSLRLIFASRVRRANLGDDPVNSVAHDLRGTAIVVSMLALFTGCWLPFYLLMLQDHISVQIIPVRSWQFCLFVFLRFIPPLSNPIFSAFCKRDFRHALRVWIRRTHADCLARRYRHIKSTQQPKGNVRVIFTRSLDEYDRNASNGTTLETSSIQRSPSPQTFRAVAASAKDNLCVP